MTQVKDVSIPSDNKWSDFKKYFINNYSEEEFRAWFTKLTVNETEDKIILRVNGGFTCDYIKNHYSGILESFCNKNKITLYFIYKCKITDTTRGFKTELRNDKSIIIRLSHHQSQIVETL